MSNLATPRVRIPARVRAGEVFEVRTLIEHPMETGLRHEGARAVPRDLLDRLVVRVNGETAFEGRFANGTATNPFHVFFLRLERTSEVELVWSDESGRSVRHSARVAVG
jgi:sulfur-oxidizing protein SoxZ